MPNALAEDSVDDDADTEKLHDRMMVGTRV